jgi:hypothetical protein
MSSIYKGHAVRNWRVRATPASFRRRKLEVEDRCGCDRHWFFVLLIGTIPPASYSVLQRPTASSAASRSSGGPLTMRASITFPCGPTISRTFTSPWTPAAIARAGYSGFGLYIRLDAMLPVYFMCTVPWRAEFIRSPAGLFLAIRTGPSRWKTGGGT